MRVRVDGSRCQGHTLCAMIAPDSFELDDVDGHAHAATDIVAGEHHDAVEQAAKSCPEQAIEIVAGPQERNRAARNGAVL